MSPKDRSQDWVKEFETFLKEEEVAPPQSVTRALFTRVRADLNPSLQLVAAKLFAVHAVAAAALILVCPQLGVGPFLLEGAGLMALFMYFGPLGCASFCGASLLGASALLASLVLEREELRVANRYRFLNVTLLASVSFAGLMLAGGSSDRMSYLFWMGGAILGGYLVLKIASLQRLKPSVALG